MAMRPYISAGPTSDPARQNISEILIDAGLPNLALDFLEPARGRADERTSLNAARAFLAIDQIDQALSELDGLTSNDANMLRVQALERAGRFDEANVLSSQIAENDSEAQSARALRAGDWASASSASDEPRRQLAEYMASKQATDGDRIGVSGEEERSDTPTGPEETTLDSVRTAVEASKSSRSTIEEALGDG